MSYALPPLDAATPRRPPGTVTAASYLLYLLAALQVVNGVISLLTRDAMRRAYQEAYADVPELEGSADVIATVAAIGSLAVALLFAAGFVALGVLDAKGKNAARIVTWVFAGIGVCCFAAGAAGSAMTSLVSGMNAPSGTNAPDAGELQRTLTEALPGWYYPTTTAISVLSLLAAIAIIALLALPASNAFFRRPQPPPWQPPSIG